MGMFCRFGFEDERRPVAAPVWLKLVCRRPVERSNERRERVHVRALELHELPELEHLAADLVLDGELFEHVGGGRDGLALAVFHRRGQPQVLEQHFAQLLRRVDVEGAAGEGVRSRW